MTTAIIQGVITRLNKVVELANGGLIRNIVVACNLAEMMVYHDVIIFDDLNALELKKSDIVYIEGNLKYKKKNENKYSEIIATKIEVKNV